MEVKSMRNNLSLRGLGVVRAKQSFSLDEIASSSRQVGTPRNDGKLFYETFHVSNPALCNLPFIYVCITNFFFQEPGVVVNAGDLGEVE